MQSLSVSLDSPLFPCINHSFGSWQQKSLSASFLLVSQSLQWDMGTCGPLLGRCMNEVEGHNLAVSYQFRARLSQAIRPNIFHSKCGSAPPWISMVMSLVHITMNFLPALWPGTEKSVSLFPVRCLLFNVSALLQCFSTDMSLSRHGDSH